MTCKQWTFGSWIVIALVLGAGCQSAKHAGGLEDGGSAGGPSDAGARSMDARVVDSGKGPRGTTPMDASSGPKHDASAQPPIDAGHDGAMATMPMPTMPMPMPTMPETDAGQDDDSDGGHVQAPIEIAGRWHSNYGGTEVIDSHTFTSFDTSTVIEYDNGANSMVTQNSATATYSPNKFNKLVWTEISGGSFYYCTVDYGLDTADAARNSAMTADASDPANAGCGGFSWTKLSPVIAVEGTWTDGSNTIAIDSDNWGSSSIVSYTTTSAVTQNPNSGSDPMKYNEVVWTTPSGGTFYYCFVSIAQASATDAQTNAGTATASDLVAGCLGAAWSKLDAH